jgi:hypothetical protein
MSDPAESERDGEFEVDHGTTGATVAPPVDARRIAAVFANPDLRTTYAEIVLGLSPDVVGVRLGPARRRRVLAALLDSGVIEDDGERLQATDRVFRELLDQHPRPAVATGIDRFVRDGRIVQYPSNAGQRLELLEWVAARILDEDEVIGERELNERLSTITDDFALLRRYLVDYDLLERTRSGSDYARATAD